MITFQSESRFFSRTNAGKYPLDVTEIRSAFALSETLLEKVRRFRDERLARIVADETPLALEASPKIVLHVLPISVFEPGTQIDLVFVSEQVARLQPIYSGGWNHRYNFDGFLTYGTSAQTSLGSSYLQIFRHGAIEAVECRLMYGDDKKLIPSVVFEGKLISAVGHYLALERDFGVNPPLFVMLSLLGVKGYKMATRHAWPDEIHPIDRDTLILPEILVEDYGVNTDRILHPTFDAIWQAAGWSGSLHYDKEGKWVGPH